MRVTDEVGSLVCIQLGLHLRNTITVLIWYISHLIVRNVGGKLSPW